MTYVYLDTNIYNDIERAAVPADDIRDFRAAVASGELVVRGSIVDLEESLGLWKEDRAAAQRRLHIFRELAGFDRLLNQPSDLLEGAIQAYAAGASMPSPLLPRLERLQVASRGSLPVTPSSTGLSTRSSPASVLRKRAFKR